MWSGVMRNKKIKDLLVKITVLTTFSIFSTFSVYVLVFVFELGSFWTLLDSMLNCWCAVLLFAEHQKLYTLMCGKVQTCCFKTNCLSCCSCHCCCRIQATAITIHDKDQNNKSEQNENESEENQNEAQEKTDVGLEITTQKA